MTIPDKQIDDIARSFYLANTVSFFIKRMDNNGFILDLIEKSRTEEIKNKLRETLNNIEEEEQVEDKNYFKSYIYVIVLLKLRETKIVEKLIEGTVLKKFRWIQEIFNHYTKNLISTQTVNLSKLDFKETKSESKSNSTEIDIKI